MKKRKNHRQFFSSFPYVLETGAVFTLGKSYLSENHQSYFYIKNDPIKKVISGDNQSAVICGWFGNSIVFAYFSTFTFAAC